jgi:hypothetical protein
MAPAAADGPVAVAIEVALQVGNVATPFAEQVRAAS